MNSLFENETYTIRRVYTLSSIDRDVLVRLYQPLIGIEAIALYLFLDNFLPHMGARSGMLIDLVRMMSYESRFSSSKALLEAVHLLSSYKKDISGGIDHIYELNNPLDPKHFFQHSLFLPALRSKIADDKAMVELAQHFMISYTIDPSYINDSAGFADLFNIDDVFFKQKKDIEMSRLISRYSESVTLFDVVAFKEEVNKLDPTFAIRDIDENVILTVSFLSELYKISLQRLANCFVETADMSGYVDQKRLTERVKKEIETNLDVSSVDPLDLKKGLGDSMISKKISTFESISPAQLIYALTANKPLKGDYLLIERLATDYRLKGSVINIIIDKTLLDTGGDLNHLYAEKIARSLSYLQLNDDPYAAIIKLYQKQEGKATYQKKKQVKVLDPKHSSQIKMNQPLDDDLDIEDYDITKM